MELQKIQGLPSLDSEGSILAALARIGIHRVPTRVYQIMMDAIGDTRTTSLQENQGRIRKVLQDFIFENYPDCDLESFNEYTIPDAKKISLYLPWGFYIKLQPKVGARYPSHNIADALKQLTFGS